MAVAGTGSGRVRPHVARAVVRARHVLLDFDGVMFDVRAALGREAREEAITALLATRPYRPRPLLIATGVFGVHETLAYLAKQEPDHAVDAEVAVSAVELDASLAARPRPGLRQLLTACAAIGRKVGVISDLSESAVVATLRAHGLSRGLGAVAARQGLDLSTVGAARAVERAADLLNVPVTDCLLVSGDWRVLSAAPSVGAVGLGCEGGRDRRKHLAGHAPVVSGLASLTEALVPQSPNGGQ